MRIKKLAWRTLLVGALAGGAVAVPAAAQAYSCSWTFVTTIGAGKGAKVRIYAKDCSSGHSVKGEIIDDKADGRNAVATIGWNDWGTWNGKGDSATYQYKVSTSTKSLTIKAKACKHDAAFGPLCSTKETKTVTF